MTSADGFHIYSPRGVPQAELGDTCSNREFGDLRIRWQLRSSTADIVVSWAVKYVKYIVELPGTWNVFGMNLDEQKNSLFKHFKFKVK